MSQTTGPDEAPNRPVGALGAGTGGAASAGASGDGAVSASNGGDVDGGAVTLTDAPLGLDDLVAAVERPGAGGICTFLGVVRDTNLGRDVDYLEYEAYPDMAVAQMARIVADVAERWPGARAAIAHRTGRLEIGEASVAIAVSAPHRAEAFAACRYAIDTLKERVPIWKKEVWTDGSAWVEGASPAPLGGDVGGE